MSPKYCTESTLVSGSALMKEGSFGQTYREEVDGMWTHFEKLGLKPERTENSWTRDKALEELGESLVPDIEWQ